MERNSKGQFKNLELKNQTINGITLLEKTDKKRRGAILWKCRCFCGNIFIVVAKEKYLEKIILKKHEKNCQKALKKVLV